MAAPIRTLGVTGNVFPLKGLFLWEADRVASDPDTVLTKSAANHITEIYVPYKPDKASKEQYAYFIRKAGSLGISVQALHGDPKWALSGYLASGSASIQAVIDYNKWAWTGERFVGIQFDVEPNGLNGNNGYPDDWNTNRAGVITSWLDNSIVWLKLAHNAGLILGAALPAWLDNNTSYPVPPAYADFGSRVSDILTDFYDYILMMGYRDDAQGTYDQDIDEVNYAKTPKIIASFECTEQTPTNITFYEEGFNAMEDAMLQVHGMLKDKPGYMGVAVHAFRQWEPFMDRYIPQPPVRTLPTVR